MPFSLSQSSECGSHFLAISESSKGLFINFKALLAKVDDIFHQRRRHNHNTIPVAYQDIARIDPQVFVEL